MTSTYHYHDHHYIHYHNHLHHHYHHLGLYDLPDAGEHLLQQRAQLVAVGVNVHQEADLGRQNLVYLQLLNPLEKPGLLETGSICCRYLNDY